MPRFPFSIAVLCLVLPAAAFAQHREPGTAQAPYAGLEARAIASLSEEDIATLRAGGGWGLALPAELNGWPGPLHLLELRKELALSDDQIAAITAMYEQMRTEAIAAGARFITAEAALSEAFATAQIAPDRLRALLAEAADARAALREVHLSRHLSTPALLSAEQIKRYTVLRGYADDPCEAVPEGHDPAMWRRHNGCDG